MYNTAKCNIEVKKVKDGTDLIFFLVLFANNKIMFIDYVDRYLKFLIRIKRLSPNSVKKAAYALKYYYEFLIKNDLEIAEVLEYNMELQNEHFLEFLEYLTERVDGKTPKGQTCNQYVKQVFLFYSYINVLGKPALKIRPASMYDDGESSNKYVKYKGYMDEEEYEEPRLDAKDMNGILRSCKNIRDHAIVSLLKDTGLRCGELLGIKKEDLDLDNRTVRVRFRRNNENGARAKNQAHRTMAFSSDTGELIKKMIDTYGELYEDSDYVFFKIKGKNKGKPMDYSDIARMFDGISKTMCKRVHAHGIRHYFAEQMRLKGYGYEQIRIMLGHKRIETTIKYVGIELDLILEKEQQYFSDNEITNIYGDLSGLI